MAPDLTNINHRRCLTFIYQIWPPCLSVVQVTSVVECLQLATGLVSPASCCPDALWRSRRTSTPRGAGGPATSSFRDCANLENGDLSRSVGRLSVHDMSNVLLRSPRLTLLLVTFTCTQVIHCWLVTRSRSFVHVTYINNNYWIKINILYFLKYKIYQQAFLLHSYSYKTDRYILIWFNWTK